MRVETLGKAVECALTSPSAFAFAKSHFPEGCHVEGDNPEVEFASAIYTLVIGR
jgi:hypothetical protein